MISDVLEFSSLPDLNASCISISSSSSQVNFGLAVILYGCKSNTCDKSTVSKIITTFKLFKQTTLKAKEGGARINRLLAFLTKLIYFRKKTFAYFFYFIKFFYFEIIEKII